MTIRILDYSNQVTIWIPDQSSIQVVDSCLVVKWSSIWMVVWKPDWKSLFIVQNVWFSNGLPSHVTLPFEYRTPTLSGIQVFSILMVTVVWYSNGTFVSCIQMGVLIPDWIRLDKGKKSSFWMLSQVIYLTSPFKNWTRDSAVFG